jgi:muramidase (phage lysozyme)
MNSRALENQKLLSDVRMKAFLYMIGESEGADYQTMVHGGRKNKDIKDLSRHPNKVQGSGRLASTAAGRYQFLYKTWKPIADALGLTDFSPLSQDIACIELFKQKGAVQSILSNDFAGAVHAVRKVWASLPGAGYGQGENTLEKVKRFYQEGLGAAGSHASNVGNLIKTNTTPISIFLAICGVGLMLFLTKS